MSVPDVDVAEEVEALVRRGLLVDARDGLDLRVVGRDAEARRARTAPAAARTCRRRRRRPCAEQLGGGVEARRPGADDRDLQWGVLWRVQGGLQLRKAASRRINTPGCRYRCVMSSGIAARPAGERAAGASGPRRCGRSTQRRGPRARAGSSIWSLGPRRLVQTYGPLFDAPAVRHVFGGRLGARVAPVALPVVILVLLRQDGRSLARSGSCSRPTRSVADSGRRRAQSLLGRFSARGLLLTCAIANMLLLGGALALLMRERRRPDRGGFAAAAFTEPPVGSVIRVFWEHVHGARLAQTAFSLEMRRPPRSTSPRRCWPALRSRSSRPRLLCAARPRQAPAPARSMRARCRAT